MRNWIIGFVATVIFLTSVFAFWHFWLHGQYEITTHRYNDMVSVNELKAHPARYLNRSVAVRGYLHRIRRINSGDVLLYPNKTEADIENVATAILIAYPFDGKMVCNDHYVEVSGYFEKLPENPALGISFPFYGIGHVDYLGKLEDTRPYPGTGLQRPSCPSRQLPEDFGVGIFRDATGRVDDPYQWKRGERAPAE